MRDEGAGSARGGRPFCCSLRVAIASYQDRQRVDFCVKIHDKGVFRRMLTFLDTDQVCLTAVPRRRGRHRGGWGEREDINERDPGDAAGISRVTLGK